MHKNPNNHIKIRKSFKIYSIIFNWLNRKSNERNIESKYNKKPSDPDEKYIEN